MKSTRRPWWILSFAVVAATGLLYAQQMGTTPRKTEEEKQADMDPAFAHWLQVTTPGSEHDVLRRLVGVWGVSGKIWENKGEPVQEFNGRAVSRMILGGRFLQTTLRGNLAGDPYAGLGLDGYDKLRNEYVSTWADNQSTGIRNFEGTAAEDGKTITTTSSQVDTDTGKPKGVTCRTTLVDPKTYRYEQWSKVEGGEEFKSMELEFTREGNDG